MSRPAASAAAHARRTRRVALRALSRYGLQDAQLRRVAESFNATYRVTHGATSYSLRVAPPIRIHRPGAAVAEADWTEQLARAGVQVPRVVRTLDASPSVLVAGDEEGDVRECMLFDWVPGRPVRRPASVRDVMELAALSAQLHEASQSRETLPAGVLDARSVLLFELPDRLDEVPARFGSLFTDALARAAGAIDHLWRQAQAPPRILHGDLTPSNVVRSARGLGVIDFQDLMWGFEVQDLATTLVGLSRDDTDGSLAHAFRHAYAAHRPWPDVEVPLLRGLQAGRRLQTVNLALNLGQRDLDAYLDYHAAALRK